MSLYVRPWEPLLAPSDLVKGPLLVVAPHPDDEVCGAAGLILAHRDAGIPVHCVVMTDGRLGDYGGTYGDDYPEIRKNECRAAAEVLGGLELTFLDFPDFGLAAAHDAGDASAALQTILENGDYATVAFMSPWELHPDHRAASVATLAAVKAAGVTPVLLGYEVGSFMPGNLLINTSDLFDRKIRALECYASQLEHHDIAKKLGGADIARTANVDDKLVTRSEAYLRLEVDRIDEYINAVEVLLRLTDGMGPELPSS